jgi:malate dehydrogenase (oxaloacetate-decarboxylating)(NADP+)
MAAHNKWGCLIQFEDFGNTNAFRLLAKYQPRVCTFNDDIQGTASVVVAGLLATPRITGVPLTDHTFLFCGAGEAGTGIAQMIVIALQKLGMSNEDAHKRCWFVDSSGLVVKSRKNLAHHKLEFAHDHPQIFTFEDAVRTLNPTALIGVSGVPNSFTKSVLEYMATKNKRSIIFALSNPTSQAECTAKEAYEYTNGTAVFASGSPFSPLTFNGSLFTPGQGNNAYIFPGVGLGIVASGATTVTDEMFFIAAQRLSKIVEQEQIDEGCLYPPLSKIRLVSKLIALAVAEHIFERGHTKMKKPENLEQLITEHMYIPSYGDSKI